jgi:hypothetical protein
MHSTMVFADGTHDALVAFLDEHLGAPRNADVGPLFGQASLIRDLPPRVADAQSLQLCIDAVNVALSSEAIREANAVSTSRHGRPPYTS